MKVHIGVDAGSGHVHTVTATVANVHDVNESVKLIREDDTVVYGDSGYLGIKNLEDVKDNEPLKRNRLPYKQTPFQSRDYQCL